MSENGVIFNDEMGNYFLEFSFDFQDGGVNYSCRKKKIFFSYKPIL